jgi:trehalose 6-phosphate phosphatase
MKNILSRGNREVLEQFAWSNVLLAFDFDGTLAPIVATPDRAAMRSTTRALLEKLTRLYPCIVISGRAHGDVLKRVRGTGVLEVVGNHGVEPWQAHDRFLETVGRWHPVLERHIGHLKGVEIEDKSYSLAIHYRRSREKKKARAAILRAAALLGAVRVVGGEQVVNILPDGAPHKGIALERARERLGCDTAIYTGDDETDEDVFMLGQPGRLLTIRVGARRASVAAYCIRDQRQVDQLLHALVLLRQRRRRSQMVNA